MDETTTVLIVAVGGVGLFLIWTSMQQQAAVQNALLAKIASQPQPAAANPLTALLPAVGPLIAALA